MVRGGIMRMIFLGLAMVGMTGQAIAQDGATGGGKVALVELFTSEGCSSCPPADAVLGKLNAMKVGDGVLVVGLSEHVTYWNYLGWKDPFSQELFTERQNGVWNAVQAGRSLYAAGGGGWRTRGSGQR